MLDNLKRALPSSNKRLVSELRQLGDVSLAEFLHETGLEIEDIYRRKILGGWAGLRRTAGLASTPAGPDDTTLSAAFGRMLHLDDLDRLDLLVRLAAGQRPAAGRLLHMLHFTLWGPAAPLVELDGHLARLWADPARCAELRQVAEVLRTRIHRITTPPSSDNVPLRIHARYSKNEACAAFGMTNPGALREGVKWIEAERADIFFVTLDKSEHHYSPTTRYQDRALTAELFQWESQSTTSAGSPTGRRYVEHAERGSTVHLFVRESKVAEGDLGVPPYLYAGPMTYERHTRDRPMRIIWRLDRPLPADVLHAARAIAA
ncbi:DUF3427 domain-containing protein [Micromonospora polyrhachis]|uniref:DUF3427 domain-containing protein n=1 Tax=Micromonospora polyrhachis TaxID=1282883 RepID=A0A7W7SNG0_9ACTN|nr:DUF3427 domain-containing protein [Micromonospora polyrhachis]MBB4957861.1 hypothetical protein [Micromonospora polyrhachis]